MGSGLEYLWGNFWGYFGRRGWGDWWWICPMNSFTPCPKPWTLNLNFDASTLESPNASGIGGVIRDFGENVRQGGFRLINEAGFLGMLNGVRRLAIWACPCSWSKVVWPVQLVRWREGPRSSKDGPWLYKLKDNTLASGEASVSYVPSATNSIANYPGRSGAQHVGLMFDV